MHEDVVIYWPIFDNLICQHLCHTFPKQWKVLLKKIFGESPFILLRKHTKNSNEIRYAMNRVSRANVIMCIHEIYLNRYDRLTIMRVIKECMYMLDIHSSSFWWRKRSLLLLCHLVNISKIVSENIQCGNIHYGLLNMINFKLKRSTVIWCVL